MQYHHQERVFMTYHYKTLGLASVVALSMLAGGAQAATLKVEVWDVLAPQPGGFTGNDEGQQITAYGGNTPNNIIALRPLVNGNPVANDTSDFEGRNVDFFSAGFVDAGDPGDSFGDNAWAGVDYIVGNLAPDLTFNINSSQLQSGFSADGLSSDSSTPSIDDFFGTSLGGVGNNSILGTVARITGTLSVEAGETYTITSDDGYRLTVGGQELAFLSSLDGGSTNESQAVVGSGFQSFEMLWFEGNTVGADLQVTGNFTPVPLPASALLLLGGLGGLGGLSALRRRKRTA
jgi:hypothetical protein